MKKVSPIKLAMIPLLMFGFGFALIPLYDVFCDITGFIASTSIFCPND